ncbi:MAG: MlaD family protein [Bacteroidota bacterium]
MKITREVKIGLVFIVGVVILFWGVNFLKAKHIFSPVRVFYAVYEKVDGLAVSNPVSVSGLNVGKVDKVELHPDGSGRVLVTFSLNTDFPLPANTTARITSDLMGAKTINLILGNGPQFIPEGDTLKTSIQGSLQSEVNLQLVPFKRKMESLMLSLDSVLVVVQSIFNENTRDNLALSFESIKVAIQNIEHMSFSADTLVSTQKGRLASILGNIESITFNFKENNSKISRIISNFATLSDTLVKADFARVISNTSETMAQTNEIMSKINSGKGSIGMLVNNDSLYRKLDKASNELDLLLQDVKLNPHRYIHISVFGGGGKHAKYEPATDLKKQ